MLAMCAAQPYKHQDILYLSIFSLQQKFGEEIALTATLQHFSESYNSPFPVVLLSDDQLLISFAPHLPWLYFLTFTPCGWYNLSCWTKDDRLRYLTTTVWGLHLFIELIYLYALSIVFSILEYTLMFVCFFLFLKIFLSFELNNFNILTHNT